MERTTISLDSELHARLKAMAAERGVSVATVIREVLKEGCTSRPRRFLSLGSGASKNPPTLEELSERVPPVSWRSS
jgi:hypothetical protein